MRFMLRGFVLCLATLATGCGGDADEISAPLPTNLPPVAAFGNSCVELACSFTDASTDSDGQVAGYRWSFGDGSTDQVTRDAEHTYAIPGRYVVVHPVRDDEGASAIDSQSVEVTTPPNVPPVAQFAASCVDLTCTFGDFSYDTDGAVAGHLWAFGDGREDSVAAPTHIYSSTGNYDVGLIVIDERGSTASAQQQVTVTLTAGPKLAVSDSSIKFCNAPGSTRNCVFLSERIRITSTGGSLHWRASSDTPWLHVSTARGTTPARTTISADPSQVPRPYGTAVRGTVTITSGGASNSPLTIPVTLYFYATRL
jgi:PKD repeat protein